jgi:hypothetical protein
MIRVVLSLLLFAAYSFAGLPPIKTYKTINECQSDIYFSRSHPSSVGMHTRVTIAR